MSASPSQPGRGRWIRPLPERVVNKIAAGEVIERPAAVVKELVENAMDAGADRIDIVVEKSGVKLIRIVDNGCGIPEEQVEIAFGRHATSKISAFDDLDRLSTYGFRGEALPSVASVSQLRMLSRVPGEDAGTEIVYEGGVLQSQQPAPAPPGTTVEVRNLFYNTPARRKFLKAESTEARHISRTATALAIGRYRVGFTFTVNGRNIFRVPPGLDIEARVSSLLGSGRKFVAVNIEAGPVKIEGYIGAPDTAQHNRYGQYIFINDRYVFSPVLSHALNAGYGELISPGTYPVGALLVWVDPTEVDVNVHPSKTEVKLSRERELHDAVVRAVRESLRQDGIIPALKTSPGPAGNSAGVGPHFSGRPGHDNVIPGIGSARAENAPYLPDLCRPPETRDGESAPGEGEAMTVDKNTGEIFRSQTVAAGSLPSVAEGPADGFRLVGRFADLYLLFQAGNDLYIVDQHTAHERVLYEEISRQIEAETGSGQALLFPVQVELSPEQLAVYQESGNIIARSGFSVAEFGGRTVNVEAVPSIMTGKAPDKMLIMLLDDIASLRKTGYDLEKAVAQSVACRSAVMAGDRLSDQEATHLLARLLKSRDRYSCPHGRPTFIKISRSDLDRQFGRT